VRYNIAGRGITNKNEIKLVANKPCRGVFKTAERIADMNTIIVEAIMSTGKINTSWLAVYL